MLIRCVKVPTQGRVNGNGFHIDRMVKIDHVRNLNGRPNSIVLNRVECVTRYVSLKRSWVQWVIIYFVYCLNLFLTVFCWVGFLNLNQCSSRMNFTIVRIKPSKPLNTLFQWCRVFSVGLRNITQITVQNVDIRSSIYCTVNCCTEGRRLVHVVWIVRVVNNIHTVSHKINMNRRHYV